MYQRLLIFMLCIIAPIVADSAEQKEVYGVYENVIIEEITGEKFSAKLDTGALTSSLSAVNIELFERDNETWVRFNPSIGGTAYPKSEKPLARKSKIKRRNTFDSNQTNSYVVRPVVLFDICFNKKVHTIEVNLTDRTNFLYPLLIGRNGLAKFGGLIDPTEKFLTNPSCNIK